MTGSRTDDPRESLSLKAGYPAGHLAEVDEAPFAEERINRVGLGRNAGGEVAMNLATTTAT